MIIMNMNVQLTGIADHIAESAVKKGLAKTKTDALVLGLVELDHRYKLTEYAEDQEDMADVRRILRDIQSGKEKLLTAKEFEKRTGVKITP
jgi:hypothetical protein